jgi:hypothetical protein
LQALSSWPWRRSYEPSTLKLAASLAPPPHDRRFF